MTRFIFITISFIINPKHITTNNANKMLQKRNTNDIKIYMEWNSARKMYSEMKNHLFFSPCHFFHKHNNTELFLNYFLYKMNLRNNFINISYKLYICTGHTKLIYAIKVISPEQWGTSVLAHRKFLPNFPLLDSIYSRFVRPPLWLIECLTAHWPPIWRPLNVVHS